MEQLLDVLTKYRYSALLLLLGLTLLIGGFFSSGIGQKPPAKTKAADFPSESLYQNTIKVDISGAVLQPGVVELTNNDRVQEAINKAGGFSDNVNLEYVSKVLNLSQKVSDGQKIYIPFKGEDAPQAVAGVSATGMISINNASQSELESLPGIGPVSAQKIIVARPYSSIDELSSKKVISASVFAKIKPQISL